MRSLTLGILLTAGTLSLLGVGYAVHFDRKRRNDPSFRKQLRRERKRVEKSKKVSEEQAREVATAALNKLLEELEAEKFPNDVEAKEAYFMQNVAAGEQLAAAGTSLAYEKAALAFFKALKVYPSPVELIMIYQKTVPQPVFELIMGLMSLDVKKKQEVYYETFPGNGMNVKVKEFEAGVAPDGKKLLRKGLAAESDLKEGQVVYIENPVVCCLEPELIASYCSNCLKYIESETPEEKITCSSCNQPCYCSEECKDLAWVEYHQVLCGGESLESNDEENAAKRSGVSLTAKQLIDHCRENNLKYPVMVARFLAQMVHEEHRRGAADLSAVNAQDTTSANDDEFTSWDHIERIRFLEIPVDDEMKREMELVKGALANKIPGLEEFVSEERYSVLKGKMLYNCIGIHTAGPENVEAIKPSTEPSRNSSPTPATGAGLYKVTSYLAHSCAPNVRATFPKGTRELALVANRDIAAGEELRISFILDDDSKSTEERRKLLAETWRFKCACKKCDEGI